MAPGRHPHGGQSKRYGEFTIIVLGEVIAAIATGVQAAVNHSRVSPGLLTAAAAGLLLVFALWWSYFKYSAAEEIGQSLPWAFVWAFAHYLIFAAAAALGAGLQVAIGALTRSTRLTPASTAFAVAIPVTIYIVVLALLHTRRSGEAAALRLTLLTAAPILAAAAATPILTLLLSVVIMVVLVALLLAWHLTAAHRAARQTGHQGLPCRATTRSWGWLAGGRAGFFLTRQVAVGADEQDWPGGRHEGTEILPLAQSG